MPIKESAKKELRKSKKHRLWNLSRFKALKDSVKKVKKLVVANQKEEAKKLISAAYQAIDKAAKRGLIKKNTAARKKSQLMRMVK